LQAVMDDGRLPLHKVTIIPRGMALGVTMMIPSKDFLNQSRSFLENQICMAMGGRIAESLFFKEITTGASSDIKQATRIARKMVCDWGMSPLGPIAYGENQDHIFLGREISRNQNYSEETARAIDNQIRAIVDTQYARATKIIEEHRSAMEKIAESLLQYETIEGKHVMEIVEFGEMRSPVVLGQQTQPAVPEAPKDVAKDLAHCRRPRSRPQPTNLRTRPEGTPLRPSRSHLLPTFQDPPETAGLFISGTSGRCRTQKSRVEPDGSSRLFEEKRCLRYPLRESVTQPAMAAAATMTGLMRSVRPVGEP